MILINIDKIFEEAIYKKDINTLEKILLSSDSRINIIHEFAKSNDINLFKKLLPEFRSKGFIQNIEECCNIIENRICEIKDSNNFKPFVKKHIHYKNVEINKDKHLRGDTF